jgi:hypothetical protein
MTESPHASISPRQGKPAKQRRLDDRRVTGVADCYNSLRISRICPRVVYTPVLAFLLPPSVSDQARQYQRFDVEPKLAMCKQQ